jgi:hypothetical protein
LITSTQNIFDLLYSSIIVLAKLINIPFSLSTSPFC